MPQYNYIIVGSGIAGLYTALLAREHGSVLLLTKGSIEECNTRYAQGGIAAAIGPGDNPQLHFQDTVAAGAGLCDEEAVRLLAEEAPDRIHDLIRFGVPFDTVHGEVALTREAAHSVSRILHAGGDATGEHIETTLSNLARRAGIAIQEYSLVVHILKGPEGVQGVRVLDTISNTQGEYGCRFLVLATGGAGRLFRLTTNPEVATGDGVALAYQAGAEIMDMEFFQFHPTALRLPGVPPFLISEAVRGEGGILRNIHREPFMSRYHPQGDLAPRDVVARSLVAEMQKTDTDHVLLDVTHLPPHVVSARFPQIYRYCLAHGLDITHSPIPVAPAAHYMMGGVRTNLWGETSVPGLYACGEAACTGIHGANRLASNSLMEVLVFGKRIVQRTVEDPYLSGGKAYELHKLGERPLPKVSPSYPSLSGLQTLLWEEAGIVRSRSSLEKAAATLSAWEEALPKPSDRPSHELASLMTLGRLMVEAALIREESRGAHYRSDFPEPSPRWLKHIIFVKDQ